MRKSRCKCKFCKTETTTDIAYQTIDDNGRFAYYCNEEHFSNHMKLLNDEKVHKAKIMDIVSEDIFQRDMKANTLFLKCLKDTNSMYDYDVICNTLTNYLMEIDLYVQDIPDFSKRIIAFFNQLKKYCAEVKEIERQNKFADLITGGREIERVDEIKFKKKKRKIRDMSHI